MKNRPMGKAQSKTQINEPTGRQTTGRLMDSVIQRRANRRTDRQTKIRQKTGKRRVGKTIRHCSGIDRQTGRRTEK